MVLEVQGRALDGLARGARTVLRVSGLWPDDEGVTMAKRIRIEVVDSLNPGIVYDAYNVAFDERNPDRPWVGGDDGGECGTYVTNSLAECLELVAEDIVRRNY